MASRRKLGLFGRFFLAIAILALLAACSGQLPPVIPPGPTPAADQTSQPPGAAEPASSPDAALLALPDAFRYQVVLRPAGQPDAAPTLISGQYRNGAWQQTSRTGTPGVDQVDEELIVARETLTDTLRSYTRAITDTAWTRWPGITFETAYGLASPFTPLRLRALATETATPEAGAASDGPTGTTKTQAFFSQDVIRRLMTAGVSAVAGDADSQGALATQIAGLFVPQTLTFWTDAQGRVVQAAGTLLTLGADNQPAPWLEMTASYSGYGDPAIAVVAPGDASDIDQLAAGAPASRTASAASDSAPGAGVTLRVRVFAQAGEPAGDAIVTVYAKGKKTVVDEKLGADAQFALKPGQYDVLIRAGGAEQWLKDVAVTAEAVASNDVLFDFAPLTVAVVRGGESPAVDVVVYPAGERVRFAGFASANPALFQLPAGRYDVEVATTDGSARKRVEGVEVRGGLESNLKIDLAQP
jgi:hypothetical protein